MSPRHRVYGFADRVGFTVTSLPDCIVAEDVPCLLASGEAGLCRIEKSYDPECGKPTESVGGAVHGVRVTIDQKQDGRVYLASSEAIGNFLDGDGETWSNISIKKGSQGNPEDDASAMDVVHRYAKQIVGAVWESKESESGFVAKRGPFKIPNTFEARAAIGPVQDRIRDQRIGIIGLGGTGAYVLDLMVKMPVAEIHLLDWDVMEWHNFMRAPGAPTCDEIEATGKERSPKVEYYCAKYSPLRHGVHFHKVRLEEPTMFGEFMTMYPLDFAFVCIDQRKDDESPRQDGVYCALSKASVPFVDSGISIGVEERAVRGAVTTSAYGPGSAAWKDAIPNAKVHGDIPGYRNVQLPEVNALAASLAVMEWRRQTEQYMSESTSFLHKFRLETPRIVTAGGCLGR